MSALTFGYARLTEALCITGKLGAYSQLELRDLIYPGEVMKIELFSL